MTTQNNSSHPFWSGFTVGAIVGTGIMYLLGTKNGRETAQKVLSNTEDFESSIHSILEFLRNTDILKADDDNGLNTLIDKMTSITTENDAKPSKKST